DLEQTIRDYLVSNNANPKPFVWTKTADEILEKLGLFCKQLLTQ
ncbi:MAG TPA: IS630 family transposase, partial [Gemmatimonadaceae bacterium]|nr:IS630 family transposase [Gemmatimonadaceae bacterium]